MNNEDLDLEEEEDFNDEDESDEEDENLSDLEKEFLKTQDEILPQIYEKLDEANASLAEAVELSEKHGVPFYASISPLSQTYRPGSFNPDFEDLAENCGEDEGWEHSAVCY